MKHSFHILLAVILFTPAISFAGPQPPGCEGDGQGEGEVKLTNTTNYQPAKGGINGNCNGGASKDKGFPACTTTLDKFLKGEAEFIQVAAQQSGGSAEMFGCWATSDEMFKQAKIELPSGKKCFMLSVTDRYAKSESEGNKGVSGKTQGSKIDVEADANSKEAAKLGAGGDLKCVGKIPGMENRQKRHGPRQIQRNPEATS